MIHCNGRENLERCARNFAPRSAAGLLGRILRSSRLVRDLHFKFRDFVSSSGADLNLKRIVKWSKPPAGSVKLNVDAACRPPSSAFVVVIRDYQGIFLEAFSGRFTCSSAPVAECMAIRMALTLLLLRAFFGAIIESNSLEVVFFLHTGALTWPWYLRDCLSGIAELFPGDTSTGVSIIFSPRTSNMVAHLLVTYALSGSPSSSFPYPPDFITNFLKNDL